MLNGMFTPVIVNSVFYRGVKGRYLIKVLPFTIIYCFIRLSRL